MDGCTVFQDRQAGKVRRCSRMSARKATELGTSNPGDF